MTIFKSDRLTWDKAEAEWVNDQGWMFCYVAPLHLWGVIPNDVGIIGDAIVRKGYYTRGWRICVSTERPHNAPKHEYDYVSLYCQWDAAVFGIHTTLPVPLVRQIIHGKGDLKHYGFGSVFKASRETTEDGHPGVIIQHIDHDITRWVYDCLGIEFTPKRENAPVLHLYVWVEREDMIDAD